jgi:uncharacterized protein (TIGR02722 family)
MWTSKMWTRAYLGAVAVVGGLMVLACAGPQESTFVRGEEAPGIDEPAMSTGLDKVDLEKLFDENGQSMKSSRFYRELSGKPQRPIVAIFPFKNDTSEHIGPQLGALLSKMETQLVEEGVVTVVSHERQAEILGEAKLQQSDLFDPKNRVDVGRQLGVQYFITGKVYDSAERTSDVRRVQYFFFMQAINVETGAIEWQHEAELTKALVPLEG